MAYTTPFHRSSRLRHLAAGLAVGLSLFLVASSYGQDSDPSERPIDLDVQVIPGDCDSTGAEAYQVPYGPDAPQDGPTHRIRVVIRTCCCCEADTTRSSLGILRRGGGAAGRPQRPTPTAPAINGEQPEVDNLSLVLPPTPGPVAPLAGLPGTVTSPAPLLSAIPTSVGPRTKIPWWLALLAIPAGWFVTEQMDEGTMCNDSGPAVGPDRPSCDVPPGRLSRT